MCRNTDEARLDIFELSGDREWFTAHLAGISKLKRECRVRAKKFFYLRKGEDCGGFIQMLCELTTQAPDTVQATLSAYQPGLLQGFVSWEALAHFPGHGISRRWSQETLA